MQLKIGQIKSKVIPILKEEGVTKCALFGSYVREENTKSSDIDILVELPEGKSLLDFVGLKFKLEEILGRKVDLVEYTAIKRRLRPYILNEQVQII